MSDDQIERVAKAIWQAETATTVCAPPCPWPTEDGADEAAQEAYRVLARAAIAAMQPTPAEAASEPNVAKLIRAAEAMVDFHNAPTEWKRPDLFQMRVRDLAASLQALDAARAIEGEDSQ